MTTNLRWWLWTCLTLLAIAISAYFGFFNVLYASDATFLGFLIFILYGVCTLNTGYRIVKGQQINYDWQYYMADSFEKLGLIGTVVGLIISFATFFSVLDLSAIETVKQVIATVASGISIALYTTLVGMVCSFALKTQVAILENGNEKI